MGRHVDKIKMGKLLNGTPEMAKVEVTPIEENDLIVELVEKVAKLEEIVEKLIKSTSKQTKNNKKEDKKEDKKEENSKTE